MQNATTKTMSNGNWKLNLFREQVHNQWKGRKDDCSLFIQRCKVLLYFVENLFFQFRQVAFDIKLITLKYLEIMNGILDFKCHCWNVWEKGHLIEFFLASSDLILKQINGIYQNKRFKKDPFFLSSISSRTGF